MKDKVYVGKLFKNEGRLAIAIEYISYDSWLCGYLFKDEYFIIKADKIINSVNEEEKKNAMKLEYKFYEKNLAPKWLEGDYDLHIEGNRMTMTSKDGKKVEARCHPYDEWRLQVGIDELKDRMTETKKPREIKVGDKVKFKKDKVDWYYPHTVPDWCKTNHISVDDVMIAYASYNFFDENECEYELENYKFMVTTIAKCKNRTLAYIMNVNNHYGFIVDTEWLELMP